MTENKTTSDAGFFCFYCAVRLERGRVFSPQVSSVLVSKWVALMFFISLTFLLSDVIVNGQTVQFFGTIVVAIKPRKTHVVGFSFIILKLLYEVNVLLENVPQKHSFLLPLARLEKCPDVLSKI